MQVEQPKTKYLTELKSSYVNNKYKLFGIDVKVSRTNFLPIKLTNMHLSLANALRRIFIAEVPVHAFPEEKIKILTNTSQYHRQVLLDRIGFITLNSHQFASNNPEDILFVISDPNDTGKPLKNETNGIIFVRLHEYVQIQKDSTKEVIADKKAFMPLNMLLLTLNPGEEIHCAMKAGLGTKKNGSGSQKVITDTTKFYTQWQSSITLYKFETGHEGVDKPETNDQLMKYIGYESKEPKAIILTVESVHKLNSNSVIVTGISVLKEKLEQFKEHLMNYEKSKIVTVELDANIPNLIKIRIQNEDHTLGHLLESYCLMKLQELIRITVSKIADPEQDVAQAEQDLLVESLSAYRKPHPLDNFTEISIRTPQTHELAFPAGQFDEIKNSAIRLVVLTVQDLQDTCDQLADEAKVLMPQAEN
jgi:DNA-directed RNA polymerase subunit L